jgi:hypothetical protein
MLSFQHPSAVFIKAISTTLMGSYREFPVRRFSVHSIDGGVASSNGDGKPYVGPEWALWDGFRSKAV